jgi:hypothetical protein
MLQQDGNTALAGYSRIQPGASWRAVGLTPRTTWKRGPGGLLNSTRRNVGSIDWQEATPANDTLGVFFTLRARGQFRLGEINAINGQ